MLCECGCGNPTRLAQKTVARLGHVKGQPIRFIHGHQCRAPHVRAARRYTRGPESTAWRGGRSASHKAGYVRVYQGQGERVLEHRAIVETMLGRPLTTDEVVHHKNGDKTDNRPENLEVMSNAEHTRQHATEMWTTRRRKVTS